MEPESELRHLAPESALLTTLLYIQTQESTRAVTWRVAPKCLLLAFLLASAVARSTEQASPSRSGKVSDKCVSCVFKGI